MRQLEAKKHQKQQSVNLEIRNANLSVVCMIPFYWQEAIFYLSLNDSVMAELIVSYPDAVLRNYNNPFHTLMRAVVGQQISVKAADAIWQRLEKQLEAIEPSQFLALEEEKLRQCGLSRQKINYIQGIARAFEEEALTPSAWQTMSDREIVSQLIAIRGIGQWTAEMFLIFHLHRPDILPLSDLGLLKAIQLLYGDRFVKKAEILELSQRWQPYRTVATWYLWRSLDFDTVQY